MVTHPRKQAFPVAKIEERGEATLSDKSREEWGRSVGSKDARFDDESCAADRANDMSGKFCECEISV